MSNDQLEEWSKIVRGRYSRALESKIRSRFKQLTKEASRTFRNLSIETEEYNNRLNRIVAGVSHLKKCLQAIKEKNDDWYYANVKACLQEMYSIVEYPNENAWNEFFSQYRSQRNKILKDVKDLLLQKLDKY